MRLEGKVAIISGGARGMGAEEARLFAREGARVVIGDVLDEEGSRVEAEINEAGGECVFVRLDVTSEDAWAEAVATAVSRFGKLDIVVNNAGVVARGVLEDTTSEEWDRVMDVNAKGVFLGTRASIPEMRKAGGGSIVNISSMSGMVGQSYIQPVYNASKGAVRIFTKSAGNPVRQRKHPGELGASWAHRHANGGRAAEQRGSAAKRGETSGIAAGTHGASDRGGVRGAVPGVGRVVVCDRSGVGDRWRGDGAVGGREGGSAKLDDAAGEVLLKGQYLVVVVAEQGFDHRIRGIAGAYQDDLGGMPQPFNSEAAIVSGPL